MTSLPIMKEALIPWVVGNAVAQRGMPPLPPRDCAPFRVAASNQARQFGRAPERFRRKDIHCDGTAPFHLGPSHPQPVFRGRPPKLSVGVPLLYQFLPLDESPKRPRTRNVRNSHATKERLSKVVSGFELSRSAAHPSQQRHAFNSGARERGLPMNTGPLSGRTSFHSKTLKSIGRALSWHGLREVVFWVLLLGTWQFLAAPGARQPRQRTVQR
jgi:hypothetical protein